MALLGLSLFLANCGTNLFPRNDANRELTAEGNISLGNEAKLDGNFKLARQYFTKATELDPTLTDGWYLKAEMELRVESIRLPDLVSELINDNKKKLPFFPDSTIHADTVLRTLMVDGTPVNVTPLDTLYDKLVHLFKPSIQAYDDLSQIFSGRATKGTFTKDKILSDFTMLSSLQTALLSLDNSPKDNQLTADYSPNNKERQLYKVMATGLKNIDSIDIDVDSIKTLFDGPEDINGMVDDLINAANISLASISDWDAEIQASNSEKVDKTMLQDPKKQMQTIILKAGYYYYNDWKNNDADYFDCNQNGLVERMIWIDTNGNDKIDWVDPANSNHAFCISDSLSIIRNDTSFQDNALFGKVVNGDDKYVFFKGPNGGEFVVGDWGVDEEQLDDADNDLDGIKDEDSRCGSDTLDNDADFIKVDTIDLAIDDSVGSLQSATKHGLDIPTHTIRTTSKMMWVDKNHDGKINAPNGDIINYSYVISNLSAIKAAINSGTAYGEWISGDWGIDEEYQDGIDNDSDGRIDEDGDIHLIHRTDIWSLSERNNYMDFLKSNIDLSNIRGR